MGKNTNQKRHRRGRWHGTLSQRRWLRVPLQKNSITCGVSTGSRRVAGGRMSLSGEEQESSSDSPSPLLTKEEEGETDDNDDDDGQREDAIAGDEYGHYPATSIFGPQQSGLFDIPSSLTYDNDKSDIIATGEALDQEPLSSCLDDRRRIDDGDESDCRLTSSPDEQTEDSDRHPLMARREVIGRSVPEPTIDNPATKIVPPMGVAATSGHAAERQRLLQLQEQLGVSNANASSWLSHLAAVASTAPILRPFPFFMQPGRGDPFSCQQLQQMFPHYQQYLIQQQQQEQQPLPSFLQHPSMPGLLPPNSMIPLIHHPALKPSLQLPLCFMGGGSNNYDGTTATKPSTVTGNHPFMPFPMAAHTHPAPSTRGVEATQGVAAGTSIEQFPPNVPTVMPVPTPHTLLRGSNSASWTRSVNPVGSMEPFPEKLHRLLCEVEAAGRADVISFVDNNSFRIHKPELFFREIVPKYFRHSRLSSFKRQLNLYGFSLVVKGSTQGGYRHELFRKDEPVSCRKIRRVAVKQVQQSISTASPPHFVSDEVAMVDNDDHHKDDPVADSFKELDNGTDRNDASIGSTERTDFLTAMADNDQDVVALHDPSALDGLYFES